MQDKRQAQMEKLAKLLSGNATEQERAAASEEGMEEAQKLWEKTATTEDWEPDTEKAWQRFQVKALAREQELPQPSVPHAPPISNRRWWFASAAAILLLLASVWAVQRTQPSPELVQFSTAANQKQEVLLPDGSRVWLNEESTLSYAKSFSLSDRQVILEGEAFFEVQKAEGKRFTILAAGTITEVIGTSFNLSAYANQPVAVQVVSGRVAFADAKKTEAVFLGPGEEAVLGAAATAPVKQTVTDPNFRAWQNGELHFANTSLEQLSKTLSGFYGQEVRLANPALGNCRFTAAFNNPALEEVLEVLKLTGNFTITRTPQGYLVSGQGCE